MDVKHVTEGIAVSSQVRLEELPQVAGRFAMLINNRPDGEEPGQPKSTDLEKAAADTGIAYRHIPVAPGKFVDHAVAEFEQAMSAADGPVLAFCRTGTRSITLWALSQAPHRGADPVLEAASKAGYDLGGIAQQLRAAARA